MHFITTANFFLADLPGKKRGKQIFSGLLLFAFALVGAAVLTKNLISNRNSFMYKLNLSLPLMSCHY